MAQATVELGQLLRTDFKLFDFNYQFDDAAYKAQLEQNIIDFYYDYEIGQETPDMFKRKFIARWQRIMPYYNKLYNTTLLSYNPLTNYSMEEALEQLSTTSSTQTNDLTTSTDGTNTTVHSEDITRTDNTTNTLTIDEKTSDYPQQPMAGGDYLQGGRTGNNTTKNTGDVTNALDSNNTSTVDMINKNTGTVKNENTANTDYSKTIEGITGTTYPDLIQKHRESLLRINDMIIEEMKACFILVY